MSANGRPQHVFCVNGSADFLHIVAEFLTDEGFRVTTSVQMSGTYDQIVAAQPDLIVVDLSPRRDDAWDLLTQLRFSPATDAIPLIVISTSPELLERAQQQRQVDARTAFLRKPFDLERLLATVRRLLSSAQDAGQFCS